MRLLLLLLLLLLLQVKGCLPIVAFAGVRVPLLLFCFIISSSNSSSSSMCSMAAGVYEQQWDEAADGIGGEGQQHTGRLAAR